MATLPPYLFAEIDRLKRDHLSTVEYELAAAVKTIQVAADGSKTTETWTREADASLATSLKHQDAVIAAIRENAGKASPED